MRTLSGRYRLERRIGAGGMSVVWRGHDLVLGRPVAVKLLGPQLIEGVTHARVRAEAQAAARLAHPNVAAVHDFGYSWSTPLRRVPYIVMELLDGETLAVCLERGPLPWREAARICAQVAAGLAAAHAHGIVHRDVKPANVMLTPAGVKLVDFGIAASVDAPEEGTGQRLYGTPAYLAPERLDGHPPVPATDMYGLGLLLYHALAGRLPWTVTGPTEIIGAHVTGRPDPLPEIAGLPREVGDLCQRCLRRSPHERPDAATAAAVLSAAAGVAPHLTSQPAPSPDAGSARPAATTTVAALPVASAGGHGADAAVPVVAEAGGHGADVAELHPTAAMVAGLGVPTAAALPRQGRAGAARNARGVGAAGARGGRLRRPLALAGLFAGALLTVTAAAASGRSATTDHQAIAAPGTAMAAGVPACVVSYQLRPGAGDQFNASLTVRAPSRRELGEWSLAFALPQGQDLAGVRGALWTQLDRQVTVRGTGATAAGDAIAIELVGTVAGAAGAEVPSKFTLDGAPCQRVEPTRSPAGAATVDVRGSAGPAVPVLPRRQHSPASTGSPSPAGPPVAPSATSTPTGSPSSPGTSEPPATSAPVTSPPGDPSIDPSGALVDHRS